MSAARVRGVRFVHPDLDAPGGAAGVAIDGRGRLATVADAAAVRQAILLLLSTAPGERVMRPGYGCALDRLVFSPADETTAGLAIHYVRQALERWEQRIEIVRLDAVGDPDDPTRLEIQLEYRVRATRHVDRLSLPLALAGGET